MPAGRPTKYNEDMQAKADWYVRGGYKEEEGIVVPTVVGLAMLLDVRESTLYRWAEKPENKKFRDTLDRVQEAQHRELVNKGLAGAFNSTITKLMLSNHGYVEKSESTQNHTFNVKEASDEELEAIVRGDI